jgi:AcrR family transcriptional regulator
MENSLEDEKRQTAPVRLRNRVARAQTIITAAKDILSETGFADFGINSIARRAGCDKQLIYRYFEGLEGLADVIGTEIADELSEELERFAGHARPNSYCEWVERLALGLLTLFRSNRIIQKIAAWELASPSNLTTIMAAARSKRLNAWMIGLRGSLTQPDGLDVGALNAIIIGAVQHLAISASAFGSQAGMSLQTEEDWERAEAALIHIVRQTYQFKH